MSKASSGVEATPRGRNRSLTRISKEALMTMPRAASQQITEAVTSCARAQAGNPVIADPDAAEVVARGRGGRRVRTDVPNDVGDNALSTRFGRAPAPCRLAQRDRRPMRPRRRGQCTHDSPDSLESRMRSTRPEWRRRCSARPNAIATALRSPTRTHNCCARVTAV